VPVYLNFESALRALTRQFLQSATAIRPQRWQSMDVSKQPAAEMFEVTNQFFSVILSGEYLDGYRQEIQPNLPWADEHFEAERVGGQPLNPGETWKRWPWALSADKFRREGEAFSHSYAERFWPKHANQTYGGVLGPDKTLYTREGIRYPYGDLEDVARLLAKDPHTRQAYVPIWFPEDTGVVHGERVPCTLGYHFLMRDDRLNVFYPIRSCDFVRHMRDDLYLAVRLLLWMLARARVYNEAAWKDVKPGMLTFWAGSLHCFINDYRKLQKDAPR